MTRVPFYPELIETPVPGVSDDEAVGGVTVPTAPGRELCHVWPHEVEHGDIIAGLSLPVDSIASTGTTWWYGSAGTWIAKRSSWGKVAVWRDAPEDVVGDCRTGNDCGLPLGASESPITTVDDCPPHGIRRPLYVVTP